MYKLVADSLFVGCLEMEALSRAEGVGHVGLKIDIHIHLQELEQMYAKTRPRNYNFFMLIVTVSMKYKLHINFMIDNI